MLQTSLGLESGPRSVFQIRKGVAERSKESFRDS
jgi:hypothetical protein